MNECQHSCSWQAQSTISKAAEGDCMASTSGRSAHHHSRQSSRHQPRQMQAAHSQPAGVLQQQPNPKTWPAAAPGRPISGQPRPPPAMHHNSSMQMGCCSSLLPVPKQALNPANCTTASRPPMQQTSGSMPPESSSTQGTPRRGASRGPRSYALALAAPNYRPPQSPNPQRDPAGAPQHSSRPSSRAQEQLRRLGTAGYADKARMQHNSRAGTPRTQATQHQHHQQQATPARQVACSSGADRASHTTASPVLAAAHVPLAAASKAAGGPSRSPPGNDSRLQCKRPGSAATLHNQDGGSWWQQQGEQQGHGSNRPRTVAAAGAPLLLADCFRPPSAASPASISGCKGQQVDSRPHTAAAVAAGWWDAASAGLDCHSFKGSQEAQQREEVLDLRRQEQQQQLWSAAHEIDGRPATRNGMRSRPTSACVGTTA